MWNAFAGSSVVTYALFLSVEGSDNRVQCCECLAFRLPMSQPTSLESGNLVGPGLAGRSWQVRRIGTRGASTLFSELLVRCSETRDEQGVDSRCNVIRR